MGRYNDYENFKRAAEAHLRHGGIEPDTVDTKGEYNSDIDLKENIDNFKTNYPTSKTIEHHENVTRGERSEWESREAEARAEQLRRGSEELRREKQEMVGEQLKKYSTKEGQEYVYEERKKTWEKKPEPPKFVEMEKPPEEKKGLFQKVTETFLPNEKVRLAREQETRYQEMKKQKALEAKIKTGEMKAHTRSMELQRASQAKHELKESPMGRFASAGEGAAKWFSRLGANQESEAPNLFRSGSPSRSLDSGSKVRELLTSGTSAKNIQNFTIGPTALTPGYRYGQQPQQRIRGHYKTIIEGKTARRVRVDQYGNEIPPGYSPSGYEEGYRQGYRQQGPPIASNQSPLMQLMFTPQTRQAAAPYGVSGGSPSKPSEPPFIAKMIMAPSSQSNIQRMIIGNQSRPFVGAYKGQPQRSAIERLALSGPGMKIGKQKQPPYMKFMGDIIHPRKR